MKNSFNTPSSVDSLSQALLSQSLPELQSLDFEASIEDLSRLTDPQKVIVQTIQNIREDLKNVTDEESLAVIFRGFLSLGKEKGDWLMDVLHLSQDQRAAFFRQKCFQDLSDFQFQVEQNTGLSSEESRDIQALLQSALQDLEKTSFHSFEDLEEWTRVFQQDMSEVLQEGNFDLAQEITTPSLEKDPSTDTLPLPLLLAHTSFPFAIKQGILEKMESVSDKNSQKEILEKEIQKFLVSEWERLSQVLSQDIKKEASSRHQNQEKEAKTPTENSFLGGMGSLGALEEMKTKMTSSPEDFQSIYNVSVLSSFLPLSQLYIQAGIDTNLSETEKKVHLYSQKESLGKYFSQLSSQIVSEDIDYEEFVYQNKSLDENNKEDMAFWVEKLKTIGEEYYGTEYEGKYKKYVQEKGRVAKDFGEWLGMQNISFWERLSFLIAKVMIFFKKLNSQEKKVESSLLKEAQAHLETLEGDFESQKNILAKRYEDLKKNPNIDLKLADGEKILHLQEGDEDDENIVEILPLIFASAQKDPWNQIINKGLTLENLVSLYQGQEEGTVRIDSSGVYFQDLKGDEQPIGSFSQEKWAPFSSKNFL